jgi:transcriptional regulator with XRE-family HTH domain
LRQFSSSDDPLWAAIEIGQRIRQAYKSRGMTRNSLADQVGITVKSIEHYEAGRRTPRLTTLEEIARVTEVSVPWLLLGYEADLEHKTLELLSLIARQQADLARQANELRQQQADFQVAIDELRDALGHRGSA